MTSYRLLLSYWDWEPSVIVGCACGMALYFLTVGPRQRHNTIFFMAGIAVLFLALVSPLDTLGDQYLFSAHALQHLLLSLAVPPLLILGLPEAFAKRMLARAPLARAEALLSNPILTWVLAVAAIALWHTPVFYNAALGNERIHVLEHLCFLVTGTMFWWPLLAPLHSLRLPAPSAVAYLFSAMFANTVLAVVITFAPAGIYPFYLEPKDALGALPLIRGKWGLSPHLDQQVGGLLMWLPGSGVYLWAILVYVFHALAHTANDAETKLAPSQCV